MYPQNYNFIALSFIKETNLKYRFCCNNPITLAIQESALEASMLPYENIFLQCQKGEEKRKEEKKGEEEVLKSDRNSHL